MNDWRKWPLALFQPLFSIPITYERSIEATVKQNRSKFQLLTQSARISLYQSFKVFHFPKPYLTKHLDLSEFRN